ncbi:RNA pyrophosphohydrolase [Gammaproteobacteria bacterium]
MIDHEGYRPNVGIILSNSVGEVLWAHRSGQQAWQFPQGGIKKDETPEAAMFRELSEEIGLQPSDVKIKGRTRSWLRYQLPEKHISHHTRRVCIGQKQIWFLLALISPDSRVRLDTSECPEFDRWHWVDYWFPIREIVVFKRRVYELALEELAEFR